MNVPAADWQKTQQQLQQQESQIQQQELFIKRRSNELGEVRKQLKAANEKLAEGLKELYQEDPVEASKRQQQILMNEQNIKATADQEQDLSLRGNALRILRTTLEPEDANIDAMVATLQRDGVPADMIAKFKSDPIGTTGYKPDTIVHLAKRARAETLLFKLAGAFQQLQKDHEELKVKAGEKGRRLVTNVQSALNQPPPVTASTKASPKASLASLDPTKMSKKELEEFLAAQG